MREKDGKREREGERKRAREKESEGERERGRKRARGKESEGERERGRKRARGKERGNDDRISEGETATRGRNGKRDEGDREI